MAWGALTIGALTLKETDILEDVTNANTGVRSVRVQGAETNPGRVSDQQFIEAVQQDIMSLMDRVMPVQFSRKSSYNGYYQATDTNTALEKWGEGPGQVRWSLSLDYLGPDNSVDLESRVANVIRSNVYASTGERWHAPAGGHQTYFTGVGSAPTNLTRVSADGPITVYRSIPAGVNPVWGCPVAGYGIGRSRFLLNGIERIGARFPCAVTGWEMNNGLVRVKPYTGASASTILLAFYDGTAWREQPWDVRVDGSSLKPVDHFRSVTVTRNDPECLIVRVVAAQPSNGNRVLVDMTLRRGSRLLEFYVQLPSSGTISNGPDVADPNIWLDSGTYALSGGPDANGLTWMGGSSGPFTTLASGGLSKSALTAMDFFVSAVIPKPASVGGDPGFESGSPASWVASGGTLAVVSGGAKDGTYFGRLTATGGAEARIEMTYSAPAVPLKQYTIAGWLRSPVALAAGAAMLRMRWYNGGTSLSTSDFAAPALTANVWTPVSGTAAAPASTTSVSRQAVRPGTPTAGATLEADSVTIREATDSGDTAADLFAQYIGAMAEKVGVTRR